MWKSKRMVIRRVVLPACSHVAAHLSQSLFCSPRQKDLHIALIILLFFYMVRYVGSIFNNDVKTIGCHFFWRYIVKSIKFWNMFYLEVTHSCNLPSTANVETCALSLKFVLISGYVMHSCYLLKIVIFVTLCLFSKGSAFMLFAIYWR